MTGTSVSVATDVRLPSSVKYFNRSNDVLAGMLPCVAATFGRCKSYEIHISVMINDELK